MTLTGTLGFVPIDEILRLLTRSEQVGAVEVTGDGFRGRVFVGNGGVDLATTSEDDVLRRHLVNSGLTDDEMLRRVASGETTLAALSESNHPVTELLREITVESLFQISDRGGEFEVQEGKTTPYASPRSFDLEKLLADAVERKKEWAEVRQEVLDLSGPISLCRDLGERSEVSVSNDDWKVISQVKNGRSVEEIADHLGITEFWTARVVARLAGKDLVEIGSPSASGFVSTQAPVAPVEETQAESAVIGEEDASGVSPGEYPFQTDEYEEPKYEQPGYDESSYEEPKYEESPYEEPEYEEPSYEQTGYEDSSYGQTGYEGSSYEEPKYEESPYEEPSHGSPAPGFDDDTGEDDREGAEHPRGEGSDNETSRSDGDDPHEELWWHAPEDQLGQPGDESSAEMEIEDQSEIPPIAPMMDSEDEDSPDAEEDTEAFLEKVFSELESDKSETKEGHGLLRRRRMGSLRDFSSDS